VRGKKDTRKEGCEERRMKGKEDARKEG